MLAEQLTPRRVQMASIWCRMACAVACRSSSERHLCGHSVFQQELYSPSSNAGIILLSIEMPHISQAWGCQRQQSYTGMSLTQ